MRKNIFIVTFVTLFIVTFTVVAFSASYDSVIEKWTRRNTYKSDLGAELRITVTYYANEYIDALIQKQAEENLWTRDEMENYKYRLLSSLSLEEYIPFHIEFDNRGPSMHMAPFDEQVTLWVGNKTYKPVDYEKRFNFKLVGKRDGLVYFPRYDEKGNEILKGTNTIRLMINGGISAQTLGKTVEFFWDTKKDIAAGFSESEAMRRLEADRLIKRLENLNSEKRDLEAQLAEINTEIQKVEERLEELRQ
ncbi:MAG TPA: hypothetical protein DCG87_03075 [Synergistaceae bacterium]|nr:hypothetical protein [Synergistaceae bacterium]